MLNLGSKPSHEYSLFRVIVSAMTALQNYITVIAIAYHKDPRIHLSQ